MNEFVELFKTILGPATIGLAIIAIINWIKMLPGAQNVKLGWLWVLLAGIFGSSLSVLYVWIVAGFADIKELIMVIVVGFFLGLGSAGVYKLADKVRG